MQCWALNSGSLTCCASVLTDELHHPAQEEKTLETFICSVSDKVYGNTLLHAKLQGEVALHFHYFATGHFSLKRVSIRSAQCLRNWHFLLGKKDVRLIGLVSSSYSSNLFVIKQLLLGDWRDGTMIKSTHASCRGPKFGLLYTHQVVHNCLQNPHPQYIQVHMIFIIFIKSF